MRRRCLGHRVVVDAPHHGSPQTRGIHTELPGVGALFEAQPLAEILDPLAKTLTLDSQVFERRLVLEGLTRQRVRASYCAGDDDPLDRRAALYRYHLHEWHQLTVQVMRQIE